MRTNTLLVPVIVAVNFLFSQFALAAECLEFRSLQTPIEKASLFKYLRSLSSVHAKYNEEKRISLLNAPVKGQGEVFLLPDGSLVRQIHKPFPTKLILKGDKLAFFQAGKLKQINLGKDKRVGDFARVFIMFLRGEEAALDAAFAQAFESSESGQWSLYLTPKQKLIRQVVSNIKIDGKYGQISSLIIAEANGDRTEMNFYKVDNCPSFSDDELLKLRSLEPTYEK